MDPLAISIAINIILAILLWLAVKDVIGGHKNYGLLYDDYALITREKNDLREELKEARKNDNRDPESGKYISANPERESEKDAVTMRRPESARQSETNSSDMGRKGGQGK